MFLAEEHCCNLIVIPLFCRSFNRSNIFQDQDKPITVPTIVVFDRKGKFVKQWGANM